MCDVVKKNEILAFRFRNSRSNSDVIRKRSENLGRLLHMRKDGRNRPKASKVDQTGRGQMIGSNIQKERRNVTTLFINREEEILLINA